MGQGPKGELEVVQKTENTHSKATYPGQGEKEVYARMTQVDWDANENTLHITLIAFQHCLTKQVSGMCRVGKLIKIWGKQEMDECPR